jgi:hypothetical protein
MAMSFFIQSNIGDLVVDIQGNKTAPRTALDAYTKKTSAAGDANQLWEFVPGPLDGYYFIQNPATGLVIDIRGNNTVPGVTLCAYTMKQDYPNTANQLWCFVPSSTQGYYFIESQLDGSVIDIEGSNTEPGTLLDAFTRKANENDNQLWTFVDANNQSVTPPAPPTFVPEPAGGYQGSENYIVANGSSCATLTGVKATIYVTKDLLWKSTTAGTKPGAPSFSIQFNAETNSDQPLDWLQFSTHMGADEGLWPWMNIWSPATITTNSPLWNQAVQNSVADMPKPAMIPAGYMLEVSLTNDGQGRVTAATWNVLDRSGKSIGSVQYQLSTSDGGGVPPGDLSPIASFQLTLGGAESGDHATFSSGAGLIVFQADQALTASGSYPGCIGYIGGTAETSNVSYGPMSAVPAKLLAQAFTVTPDSAQARKANPQARKAPKAQVKAPLEGAPPVPEPGV